MLVQLRAAVVALALLTLLTGVIYPLLVTGVAQAAFAQKANGSLVMKNGSPVGSRFIGQQFDDPKYFWGRLSATADANGKALPYNAAASGGSNLGPTNPAEVDEVHSRIAALQAADPDNHLEIPVDLVTSSASGLDPEISPAAAQYQAERVAKTRGMDPSRIRALIASHTEERTFGILGEPRVNVLELNLAIDAMM